eukprot:scaffold309_cov39-Phaeocystis_antarctica.AAC.4
MLLAGSATPSSLVIVARGDHCHVGEALGGLVHVRVRVRLGSGSGSGSGLGSGLGLGLRSVRGGWRPGPCPCRCSWRSRRVAWPARPGGGDNQVTLG